MITQETRGFTLIEVLAALAVIAIAMTALLTSSAQLAKQQQQLEVLSFASWMADNVLTEAQLKEPYATLGKRDGEGKAGPFQFRWTMVVQATPEPAIRRMDVHIYARPGTPDAAPIYSLTGFSGP